MEWQQEDRKANHHYLLDGCGHAKEPADQPLLGALVLEVWLVHVTLVTVPAVDTLKAFAARQSADRGVDRNL